MSCLSIASLAAAPRQSAWRSPKAVHGGAQPWAIVPRAASISKEALASSPIDATSDGKLQPALITRDRVRSLEAELDNGAAVKALKRFNDNLAALDEKDWAEKLRPVFHELAHNLETFNPAFTAVMLKVQMTVGASDYERRDVALQNLIQPLAGEYGVSIGMPLMKTHRKLFSEFYESVMHEPLAALLEKDPSPPLSSAFFAKMMGDIMSGGGRTDALEQASYAMGYNLAIEYLADYEKTWMLDAVRALDSRVLSKQGREVDYPFLIVHAEHECEHAAIGHTACVSMVPEGHEAIVREAMLKHDQDMAHFYGALADMLA